MKTSIRIMTIFIVLTFITSDFASDQNRVNNQTSVINEQPVSQTQRTVINNTPTLPAPSSISSPPVRSPEPSDQPRQLINTLANLTRSTGTSIGISTGSENILVIPTEEIGIEELLTINEDMNVMSRIFANGLSRQRTANTSVEWYFSDSEWVPTYYDSYDSILGRSTGNTVSSMYLQGYGALFLMKVDFPLSAPPSTEEPKEEETEEDIDKVWEQTRQQIYEPQVSPSRTARRTTTRPEVEYDAEKVETLKTTLIQSLKHAVNIRALKQDESIILRITGINVSQGSIKVVMGDRYLIDYGDTGKWVLSKDLPDSIKFSSSTTFIISAKKSDIDAFAKGDLDFDKFREKVQTLSYPLISGNTSTAR